MKLGIEKTAMIRVRAGISYALTEAMDEGHCGLPTDELVPLAEKLLEVAGELVRTALHLELTEGTVIADRVGETPCVFLAGLHRAERHCRAADTACGRGVAMGRAAYRSCPRGKPGSRDPARADLQGAGHDRWSRREQDHHRQSDSAHPRGEGHQPSAVRSNWPRRQAHGRGDWL